MYYWKFHTSLQASGMFVSVMLLCVLCNTPGFIHFNEGHVIICNLIYYIHRRILRGLMCSRAFQVLLSATKYDHPILI